MSHATTLMGDLPPDLPRTPAAPSRPLRGTDMLLLALIAALLVAVWQLSRMGLYTAKSDTGYWIGVTGGVMMLLLFAYPLRKRWPFLARFGKAKFWFVVHMVLGIGGPLMVIAHSTFRIGSVNAGVALYSMLIVAASGVVGRFLYLRIHRGLGGERESFEALQQALGLHAQAARSRLHFAPNAEARLREFEKRMTSPSDTWTTQLHRLLVLPLEARRVRRACMAEIDALLRQRADERRRPAEELRDRRRRLRRLVGAYTDSVCRVSQLAASVRLFALWHVLHVPFVWIMVVCAIAHVVAVHAY